MGAERLARLAPSTDPQQVAQLAGRDHAKRSRFSPRTACSRCAHRATCRRSSARWPSKGRALESLRLLALATFLDSIDESRAGHPPRAGIVSAARGRQRPAPRRSRARSAQVREKIDPSGDVVDHASPELRVDSRSAAQAADAAAQHARVVPARQGDREISAGSGRHRAQRPLRAASSRPSTAAAFRASCTARRRAARACFSSRSARSRSTTTSSRSRSRRPRRSAASCSR